jgi:CheY-like chemotaxis protein/tRNA A-37 threonylcarbamoyl transferase component Bud32
MATESLRVLAVVGGATGVRQLADCRHDAGGEALEVRHAPSLSDSLSRLAASRYDLVVLDLALPEAPGLQPLRTLRDKHPGVPVVVLATQADDGAALAALREGAQDCLIKGETTGRRLLAALRFAVERHRLQCRRNVGTAQLQHPLRDTQGLPQGSVIPGCDLPGYRVERILGQGNMAIVYLATHEASGRRVAVKVMKLSRLPSDAQSALRQRFQREAQVAAQVKHTNLTDVLEYGVHGPHRAPFIVMEFVSGQTLAQWMEQHAEPDFEARLYILLQAAQGLAALHQHGICHRDVKPANIMLNERLQVKISDFGIVLVPDSRLTIDQQLLGSPSYMAPESYVSAKVTPAADIFSLGVVAYELLVGTHPFSGETIAQVGHLVRWSRPLAPRKVRPDFPPVVQNILATMLHKEPGKRPAGMTLVAAQFEAVLANRWGRSAGFMDQLRLHLRRGVWG